MENLIAIVVALIALAGVLWSGRSDKTKNITEAAVTLIDPLTERNQALAMENLYLRECLKIHGIDIEDCHGSIT